jgi:hypothetical protein
VRRRNALTALLQLTRHEQRVIVEAVFVVCVVSAVRRLIPARLLHRLLLAAPNGPRRNESPAPERIVALVEAAARRLPCATSCLDRAIAARWILGRAGVRTALVLGSAASPPFAAHAWLDLSGAARDTTTHHVLWYSR